MTHSLEVCDCLYFSPLFHKASPMHVDKIIWWSTSVKAALVMDVIDLFTLVTKLMEFILKLHVLFLLMTERARHNFPVHKRLFSNILLYFTCQSFFSSACRKILLVFQSRRERSHWCNALQAQNPSLLPPPFPPSKRPDVPLQTKAEEEAPASKYSIQTWQQQAFLHVGNKNLKNNDIIYTQYFSSSGIF